MRISRIALLLLIAFLSTDSSYAQDWEQPFKVDAHSLKFDMPSEQTFAAFDSIFVFVKVRFKENENQIDWISIIRVDLFRADTTAYHFMNASNGWHADARPFPIEDYPDQIIKDLHSYLEVRLTRMDFEPIEHAQKYRLIPFAIPVHLK